MVSGVYLALNQGHSLFPNNQTLAAATVPQIAYQRPQLPFGLGLNAEGNTQSTVTDTVREIIRDTVTIVKPKYVKVLKHKHTTDTIREYISIPGEMPSVFVNNQISGVREEQTQVDSQSSKRSEVTLTVDGQVVYSTENDIHSTEDRQ